MEPVEKNYEDDIITITNTYVDVKGVKYFLHSISSCELRESILKKGVVDNEGNPVMNAIANFFLLITAILGLIIIISLFIVPLISGIVFMIAIPFGLMHKLFDMLSGRKQRSVDYVKYTLEITTNSGKIGILSSEDLKKLKAIEEKIIKVLNAI